MDGKGYTFVIKRHAELPAELLETAAGRLRDALAFLPARVDIAVSNIAESERPEVTEYSEPADEGLKVTTRSDAEREKFRKNAGYILANAIKPREDFFECFRNSLKVEGELCRLYEEKFGEVLYQEHYIGDVYKFYDLDEETRRELEDRARWVGRRSFRFTRLLPRYEEMRRSGIKFITDCKLNSLKEGEAMVTPFIQVKDDHSNAYVRARGGVIVGMAVLSVHLGEAVYFWKRAERVDDKPLQEKYREMARLWASYGVVHEVGGHLIGGLKDLDGRDKETEYRENWGVMRASLNAETLYKEYTERGEARFMFTPKEREQMAKRLFPALVST